MVEKSKRGSILLAALFVAAIGGYLVTSYLKAVLLENKLADQNYYTGSAKNLAEAGAETGVLALNNNDWTGWNLDGPEATRQLPLVDIGNNLKGKITVKIEDRFASPKIISEGRVDLPTGKILQEQIEVTVRPRALFANALTARNYVYFYRGSKYNNTIKVDSYDSAKGEYHSFFNRKDKGTVASKSVYTYSRSNAEIYGYLTTQKGRTANTGRRGRIYGSKTPNYIRKDQSRIATDFKASFTDKTAPYTRNKTKWSSRKEEVKYKGSLDRSNPKIYRFSGDLSIGSSQTLKIYRHVVLVIGDDFYISGKIEIKDNSSLTVYVKDDFRINSSGKIELDSKNPRDLIINSTATGNGRAYYYLMSPDKVYGTIYAPRAYVDLRGNNKKGTFFGAVVGDRIVLRGEYRLHFDEQLKNYGGENPTYTIEQWQKLNPQDMVTLIP